MLKKYYALPLAAALLCGTANAGTGKADFDVLLTVTESCTISDKTPENVNFGSKPRASGAVSYTAEGQLFVDCSQDTRYYIGLNGGNNAGAASTDPQPGSRQMANPAKTVFVKYELFSDATRKTFWGNTEANGLSRSGKGRVDGIAVYGEVTSANVAAGSYKDTVTATIVY